MKRWKRKGMFGYRAFYKKKQVALVGLFAAAILAQLAARAMTDWESMKNVLTVSAIITVLPMANLASPLLATLKYPSITRDFYEKCRPYEERAQMLYELIITSGDLILPVDAAAIHPTGVYCYCPKKDVDVKKAEKYLNGMLTKWKLDGNARVMTEERTFFKRLESLRLIPEEEQDGSVPHVEELLRNLSI